MYGNPWPTVGEIDIYENWDLASKNLMTLHTDASSVVGDCTLVKSDMTGTIATDNCDNTYSKPPQQYAGQGCGVDENDGQWGSAKGGVCKCSAADGLWLRGMRMC